eukprot:c54052_g1_i1 orf=150-314(+)
MESFPPCNRIPNKHLGPSSSHQPHSINHGPHFLILNMVPLSHKICMLSEQAIHI